MESTVFWDAMPYSLVEVLRKKALPSSSGLKMEGYVFRNFDGLLADYLT
jgi:hypothetical protein